MWALQSVGVIHGLLNCREIDALNKNEIKAPTTNK